MGRRRVLERAERALPDRIRPAARWGWHHVTLRGSRRIVRWRMQRRARAPHSLNQRLNYKLLHDRRPILTQLADKVEVKRFVTDALGPGHVPGTLVVADSVDDIDWSKLPQEYVAKVNHGSGGVVMVTSDAPLDARLPEVGSAWGWDRFRVRPEHADPERIADLCRHWLTLDYSWARGMAIEQWCYSGIPRQVMVEDLLRDSRGEHPAEYRLFVINGSVAFLQVEIDVFGDHRTSVIDREGRILPVQFVDPPPDIPPPIPASLKVMVKKAERLALAVVDFVRVDIYDLGDRLVVGEMTHYPSGGRAPISSDYYSRLWGQDWVLPY